MASTSPPDVVVIGAGYVGLTLALHMASHGLTVQAVDIDQTRIAELARGETAIFEDGIRAALHRCVGARRLGFSTSVPGGAPVWIVAVAYFPGAPEAFLPALGGIRGVGGRPPLVMIRGTVPTGYTRACILPRLEQELGGALDDRFHLVSAPERTLSGAALVELARLPQLVGGSPPSLARAQEFLAAAGISCVALPSFEAAEIAKTFTNFARMVQFNLANFLGVVCHQWDLSEQSLIQAMTDAFPRLDFLTGAGPGVGGFCLPKDSLVLHEGLRGLEGATQLAAALADYPYHEHLLNEQVIQFHADRVLDLVAGARQVLGLGVAFKGVPRTDDTRGSVGLRIVQALAKAGVAVQAYDRTVTAPALRSLGVAVADVPLRLTGSDAVLLLNNDGGYRRTLAEALPEGAEVRVRLYDPWRLLVEGHETIFQADYPLRAALARRL